MKLPVNCCVEERRWSTANRSVMWGWKRDEGKFQRVIVFIGEISRDTNYAVYLKRWFFYYRNRCNFSEAETLKTYFDSEEILSCIGRASIVRDRKTGLFTIEVRGGPERKYGDYLLSRLMNRRRRKSICLGKFPSPCTEPFDLEIHKPLAIYVGSGLSYEAGLPTLAEMHERFGVDSKSKGCFTFGADDPVPRALSINVPKTFAEFVSLHLQSMETEPSNSHRAIARLISEKYVVRLLTDNIDNLFSHLDVDFMRTRGIGIFNEPHKINFDRQEKTLLVGGVAADRRSVIKQARQQGLKIVVVNPYLPVSPNSQNLSYIRAQDIWYNLTMEDFLREIGYVA